jgi:RimJ/RimL family protein N-acetyltransferase
VTVRLREVEPADLPWFFANQADADAASLAGVPSRDRETFDAHWERILNDPSGLIRTVLEDEAVAGNVLSFVRDGERELGYWLGRAFWGRGVASAAVAEFLRIETRRPLFAFVMRGNAGSLRVLEKCGFAVIGSDDEGLRLRLD